MRCSVGPCTVLISISVNVMYLDTLATATCVCGGGGGGGGHIGDREGTCAHPINTLELTNYWSGGGWFHRHTSRDVMYCTCNVSSPASSTWSLQLSSSVCVEVSPNAGWVMPTVNCGTKPSTHSQFGSPSSSPLVKPVCEECILRGCGYNRLERDSEKRRWSFDICERAQCQRVEQHAHDAGKNEHILLMRTHHRNPNLCYRGPASIETFVQDNVTRHRHRNCNRTRQQK